MSRRAAAPSRSGPFWLIVGLALLISTGAVAGSRDVIFRIDDARGDDNGDGTFEYPVGSWIGRGELDLKRLVARKEKDGTLFEATFSRRIRVPGPGAIDAVGTGLDTVARHGFYLFNLDIYIDMDRRPGSGSVRTLPGRVAEISPDDAWDRAICLTPRPSEGRRIMKQVLRRFTEERLAGEDEDGIDDVQRRRIKAQVARNLPDLVYFPDRVRVVGSRVRFFVPGAFLDGPASEDWSYVVVVTASDLYQSLDLASLWTQDRRRDEYLLNLPVDQGRTPWALGTTVRRKTRLLPPIMDMIDTPGRPQSEQLTSYDLGTEAPAILHGIVPSEVSTSRK